MYIVESLYEKGKLNKDTYIIANGFKRKQYTENLGRLLNNGFHNCIPVLDNLNEIDDYDDVDVNFKVGIRIATDEEPQFNFWTSRLGVRYNDVMHLYENKIAPDERISLKLLHFLSFRLYYIVRFI